MKIDRSTLRAALVACAFVASTVAAFGAAAVKPGSVLTKVDTSSSAGAVDLTKCSSAHATYGAAGAFDGVMDGSNGRWLAVKADNMYVTYKFNAATKVNAIKLYNPDANSQDTRAPKAWTFQGSNDGSTWTTLDTQTNQTSWQKSEVRAYAFENNAAYVYYKFNCTEINGASDYLMLWEIEFCVSNGLAPTDLTTLSSGSVTASSATHNDYPAYKAFDGNRHNTNGRWLSTKGDHMYLVYHFNTATAVNAISVFNGSDSAGGWNSTGRAPKAWTFSGSQTGNDGSWVTLDTQTDETGWNANSEERYYAFNNRTAYEYYKFDCTELNGGTDYLQLWELEFYFVNAEAPKLGNVAIARTGASTYSVSAEEAANTADTMYWIADDGTSTPLTHSFATSVTAGLTANGTASGFTANKTYQISVLAENTSGEDEKVAGTLYAGELALGATTDAYEYQLQAGGVVVSRANADPWPLMVNYTISGSAGTGGTTWAVPEAVMIPANSASATLPVKPLKDDGVTADVTITVTLAAGNYEIPATASKTLTLYNLAIPAGKKVWTASAAGNASDGSNWTPSGAPTAADEILFAGAFSNARCYWDADATHTIASLTVDSDFAGVVEIQTTYDDGAFPVLYIIGDCTVNGGKVTQKTNGSQQLYRLALAIGGDFATAVGTEIVTQGKGISKGNYHAGSALSVHGGSINDISKVYGDFKHPTECGSGGGSDGMAGGGAVHLVVAGSSTVNGKINACPTWEEKTLSYGAGGSIYIQTASLSGSGEISAAGWGSAGSTAKNDGAGGRVAIILTSANTLDFPKEKILTRGTIGGYGRTSGGGTLFIKTANQENGTLVIVNEYRKEFTNVQYWPTKRGVTPIPVGETWTLDALEFRGMGVLCVPEGTTLNVPIGSISATEDRASGILYEGGTINFGSAPYTMANKWVFQADVPYTFNGDVVVTNGASIGCLRFSGSVIDGSDVNGAKSDDYAVCDVTVNGNLTIASGGYASAEMGGPGGNAGTDGRGDSGGFYSRHGGQYATQSGNHCYGSVFNPVLPGQFAQCGDHATAGVGGGALKLTVTGNLVVDGRITADGVVRTKSSAPAGSVNITAGTLSGAGSITATGKPGSIQWDSGYNGVGGRIAVRVTGEDVGDSGIWTKFAALGCATNQVVANGAIVTDPRNQNASAGTIYLQGMSDGEKGGTIYVKNQPSHDTSNVATWIPAGARGDEVDDFKKASLVVADRGVVAVGADKLAFASVSIAENSKIDLAGKRLKASKAFLNGEKLASGEYAANDVAVAGNVVDSVGGGIFRVGAGGFNIIVR